MSSQILTRDKPNLFSRNTLNNSSASSSGTRVEDDVEGKVKTRLMSMWNNMKYGWTVKLKTNFSKESPVWLLGRCYHKKPDNTGGSMNSTELGTDVVFAQSQGKFIHEEDEGEGIDGFKLDFVSRLWLTYRREFPIMDGSNFSSDCGWGCMLRSGQMMLAQALVCHFLSRDWRWIPDQAMLSRESFAKEAYHRMIVKWFGDKPSHNSPLSIHKLVYLGEASGKLPGDWYGPAFVAHLLKQAVQLASKENYEFDNLNVYVAQDCAVYLQDIMDECTRTDGRWKSLVIMVPVRLGTEKFNGIYGPCLTTLLSHENCIGIIGGRPKHSLYFVGYQGIINPFLAVFVFMYAFASDKYVQPLSADDKLIHLDPHYCQEMVDVWAPDFPLDSFHCRSPRKIHLSKMDPSCCVGFYCSTKSDFFNFVKTVQPFLVPPTMHKSAPAGHSSGSSAATEYPMFVFCEGRSVDTLVPPVQYPSVDMGYNDYPTSHEDDLECEEFEIV